MTAILGYADGEHVWIGGDSSAQNGHWTRFTVRERKVFRLGKLLIGGAGSLRPLQAIRTGVTLLEQADDLTDLDYLLTVLVPAMQAALSAAGTKMEGDDGNITNLVLGYHGVLYCVPADFSIRAHDDQMYNLGNGGDIAFGAFAAYMDAGNSVEIAMIKALEVSAKFDLTVAPPFYVECI